MNILSYLCPTKIGVNSSCPINANFSSSDKFKSLDDLKSHIVFSEYSYEILFTYKISFRRFKISEQAYLMRKVLLEQAHRRGIKLYGVMEYHMSGDIHCHAIVWQKDTSDRNKVIPLAKYWRRHFGLTFVQTITRSKYPDRYLYIHKQHKHTGYPAISNI